MKNNIVVGISQGDINGIGYEVIIKSLSDLRINELCTPVIYGSSKVAAYHRKALGLGTFTVNSIANAKEAVNNRINIVNCLDENIKVELGKSTEIAGEAAFLSLSLAVSEMKLGYFDVLVTAPINKDNIQSEDFKFPGHTEYLEAEFKSSDSLMLMVSDVMRVAVLTGHIPLDKVAESVTPELIRKKLSTFERSLKRDFGIRKPRIAVLGLNPHAGDNGVIGLQDKEIVDPTLEKIRERGMLAFGPFAADGFFGSGEYKKYDGVLAMYHDQGLVPFKALAMESGVNFTAGLSVVRTSPAHGTAYQIAGKNLASEASFKEALYLGIDIFKKREEYDLLTKNQLRKQSIPNSHGNQIDEVPKEIETPEVEL